MTNDQIDKSDLGFEFSILEYLWASLIGITTADTINLRLPTADNILIDDLKFWFQNQDSNSRPTAIITMVCKKPWNKYFACIHSLPNRFQKNVSLFNACCIGRTNMFHYTANIQERQITVRLEEQLMQWVQKGPSHIFIEL